MLSFAALYLFLYSLPSPSICGWSSSYLRPLAADEQQHRNRVLALAGLFQAAGLVKEIARTGAPEAEPYAASIHSVLQIDAADVETIFGKRLGLKTGLGVLAQQLKELDFAPNTLASVRTAAVGPATAFLAEQLLGVSRTGSRRQSGQVSRRPAGAVATRLYFILFGEGAHLYGAISEPCDHSDALPGIV